MSSKPIETELTEEQFVAEFEGFREAKDYKGLSFLFARMKTGICRDGVCDSYADLARALLNELTVNEVKLVALYETAH